MSNATYFGFEVGQRVKSGESTGTVVSPNYEPSDDMDERRCVPVMWDGNLHISWTLSTSLALIS